MPLEKQRKLQKSVKPMISNIVVLHTSIMVLHTNYRGTTHQTIVFYTPPLSWFYPPCVPSNPRSYWNVWNVTRARVLTFIYLINAKLVNALRSFIKISQNQTSRGESCKTCHTLTLFKSLNTHHHLWRWRGQA